MTRGCSCAARGCTANKSALPRFFGAGRAFFGACRHRAAEGRRRIRARCRDMGGLRRPRRWFPKSKESSLSARKGSFRLQQIRGPRRRYLLAAPHNWPEGFRTARLYSAAALCEEAAGAVGRLLAISSSTSCGACTTGALAEEDEEAAGFLSLSVTAYR